MAKDRRCGTCRLWRPHRQRDVVLDRHYGKCVAPLPKNIPASFDRSFSGERWETAQSTGVECGAWKAGGKHGDLK